MNYSARDFPVWNTTSKVCAEGKKGPKRRNQIKKDKYWQLKVSSYKKCRWNSPIKNGREREATDGNERGQGWICRIDPLLSSVLSDVIYDGKDNR